MPTLSLFEEAPAQQGLSNAFEHWLSDERHAGALRQPGSIAVYREMWRGFQGWCLTQSPPVTLESLAVQDLQAFQAARLGKKSPDLSLTPRHALRLMRLIDWVLRHRAAQSDVPPNTAASDWLAENPHVRYADAASGDPLPEVLSVAEARHLIAFLSNARPRPGASAARRDAHAAFTWQELRNCAAVALHLGGGLTPAEVRALTLSSPISRGGRTRDRPWKISIPANGNSPARETPIAPWAGELLQHWLQIRSERRIPGDMLFPSTATGKPWSKQSHYAATRQLLAQAGLDGNEGGTFKLRHTFAVRQLRRGTAPGEVARWLGVEVAVMERYQHVVIGPVDVV
ncbi:tyrosine-type recombinase/integrase [Variovorax sp. J31P207]|uniref:tyrosine-type recombinase/integrase n=1 Tax=Variovorax sp. J31P207 TaxID=3053510 RepID=UPI0025766EDC|nr:tyrosine-type recombinase/integrase [Variovorax sp. J31P207]MDM0071466.1 tyrosine-type recombinase/integrase [Variovorax sp. J31P207]